MDALTLLKNDHLVVKKLFKDIDGAPKGSAKRGSLFKELKKNLEVHDAIEERIFYPTLKKHAKAREIVLEAHEEHHVMRLVLKELAALRLKDEAWDAKFQVLMENVLHHAKEEEGEMFPKARRAVESQDLEELGARMEELKEKEMAKR